MPHKLENNESYVVFIKEGILTFQIITPNASNIKEIQYNLAIVNKENQRILATATVKGNTSTSTALSANINDIELK